MSYISILKIEEPDMNTIRPCFIVESAATRVMSGSLLFKGEL